MTEDKHQTDTLRLQASLTLEDKNTFWMRTEAAQRQARPRFKTFADVTSKTGKPIRYIDDSIELILW